VKSLDLSRLDPYCVLQDHTGEVGASLHREIMDRVGYMIQVRYSLHREIMDRCGYMIQ
jgi:hypothetical protein